LVGWSFPGLDFGQRIAGYPDFEIVESAPVETTLNSPEIRDTYTVWLKMINGAKKSLDIEVFYITSTAGEPFEDILAAITQAGEKGVRVRIISDKKFYETYPQTIDRLKKGENIEVRIIDMGEGVMHAKYFIVDNREVFLGSQNFDWRALEHIREIGVRIRNEDFARIIGDLFNLDWEIAAGGSDKSWRNLIGKKDYSLPIKIAKRGGETIEFYPVYSPVHLLPDEKLWEEKHLVKLISDAKESVLIQLLSYTPVSQYSPGFYPVLDNALRSAAARGVKVKLILSDWTKYHPKIDHLKSLGLVPNIEVKLSTIPQWSKGAIAYARVDHSKYLVVDRDKCWIGTANWEKGYFHSSRNVGVIVANGRINKILRDLFMADWKGPYTYPLRPEVEYTPPQISGEEKPAS
jgi:phosphatidylserine/phosphatidylglycerophosphate/cardiolipin synthase-like enzyme